jgi:two-component sensor histidine kinase
MPNRHFIERSFEVLYILLLYFMSNYIFTSVSIQLKIATKSKMDTRSCKLIKKFTLLLIVLYLNIYKTTAQDIAQIDSLHRLLKLENSDKQKAILLSNIAETYYFNQPDSAIYYCHKGMVFSMKINDLADIGYFNTFLGVLHKNISNYDSAIFYFEKAIEVNRKNNFERGIAANLNNMGKTLSLKGDYEKALKCYFQSLEIFEHYSDTLNSGELHSNIGGLQLKLNDYKAAEEHFINARNYYQKAGVKLQEAWILYDMGCLKMKTENLEEAIQLLNESAVVWKKFDRTNNYNDCMLRIGEIFLIQNNYNSALKLFTEARKAYHQTQNMMGVSETLLLEARVNMLQQKYSSAIGNLNKALLVSNFIQSNGMLLEVYNDLYVSYKKLGNTNSALEFHEKYLLLKDTVFSQTKNKLIAEYQTKLDVFNKELTIKALEDSTAKQMLYNQQIRYENRQKQTGIYFLSLVLIIILTFLYLLFRRNRTNLRLNKELNESLKEREVLIREVHHRVKNNLQIISSLLNLQSERTDNEASKVVLQTSQSRLEAMSMIHENLYRSSKLSEINLKEYIENLCCNIDRSYHLSDQNIQLNCHVDPIQIEIDQLVPCGLIINELLTNSIKYAFRGQEDKQLIVLCRLEKSICHLEINDNGIGLPEGFDLRKTTSLGLRLADGLARQLKSTLKIGNNNGVKASVTFAVKKMFT